MEIDSSSYHLSAQLTGHEDDVRRICVCGKAGIATSSRDKTVRFWAVGPGGKYFNGPAEKVLVGHTSFVGPLAWIGPNYEFKEGGLVSGGMDTFVYVWDLKSGERVQSLIGHKMQVTGVVLGDGGEIVSASVDCTLKRWRNGQELESWQAHSAAVQAVIRLSSGHLVTGSSDATMKLWQGNKCVQTFTGHSDTVRGLAVMSDLILSASHDGSVRLWTQTGEVLMEMVGHTAIVYSVDSHDSGLVVSGSEDCSAKIWKDGACVQSLEHPGCVWDVKFLENGDIVTACSDGVVRIWTTHPDRSADRVEQESFSSLLYNYKLSRKKVGGLKLEELPGLDSLKVPGTSNGQTKIVREGDNGVAYSWNMIEQNWEKIGEVVDGPEDGLNRSVFNGKEYDYVFDVDIGDGLPIRKLPYNRSDNPYDTADKWLLNENLPVSYRQQIVDFIMQNSGQNTFNFDPDFRDPYTGANAYVPGETSNKHGVSGKPPLKHIPKKGFLLLDEAKYDGILKKLLEFNNNLLSDDNLKLVSLSEVESSRVGAVVKILKETSYYHSSSFADADIDLLLKLLNTWPMSMVFPVFDILRMVALHPDGADKLSKRINGGYDTLVDLIKKATSTPVLSANVLTSIRVVINLFKNSYFHQWLQSQRSEIIDSYSGCYTLANKGVQVAYSKLLLNYAVLLIEKRDDEGQLQVLSAALEIAEADNADVETKYYALVAIGSLMLDDGLKKVAKDLDIETVVKSAKASTETLIAEVGGDIEALIKQ